MRAEGPRMPWRARSGDACLPAAARPHRATASRVPRCASHGPSRRLASPAFPAFPAVKGTPRRRRCSALGTRRRRGVSRAAVRAPTGEARSPARESGPGPRRARTQSAASRSLTGSSASGFASTATVPRLSARATGGGRESPSDSRGRRRPIEELARRVQRMRLRGRSARCRAFRRALPGGGLGGPSWAQRARGRASSGPGPDSRAAAPTPGPIAGAATTRRTAGPRRSSRPTTCATEG